MANLELRQVSKSFQGEAALQNLSIEVAEGETLVLFGPSGAGKTLLLRLIAGLIYPDEGQVLIDGNDLDQIEAEDRGVGMAFQNFALFPHMSAFENIASPLRARRQSPEAIRAAVDEVASLLKIEHVLEHAPRALSNGQKQRTALARALIGSPPILLLDDPLRNVDAKLRFEMRLELPRLLARSRATVIYVTQDYKEALALGDRIAVMDAGRVIQCGTPADIYLQPDTIEIARQFGDPTINLLDVVPTQQGHGAAVSLSNLSFELPQCPHAAIGKDCVIGIRPESIKMVDAVTPGAIPVEIQAETPLNERVVTLVHTLGGRELLLSRPAHTSTTTGEPGSKIHIHFDVEAVLLFDRASSRRIADGTAREAAA